MIIDSIALTDFGVYAGRQCFDLTPPHHDKPIVLFGGLNGGGKTTLLDAVQLALYGARARCSGRGGLSYREYLRSMIHRGADPMKGASVELSFRRALNGGLHEFRVVRSWHENSKGLEDSVQVYRAGHIDPLLSEHWDEYVESFIPIGIAHLFFFDAEQITELAEGEHAAEILGTAIHTLLGLNIVERLGNDLLALERRKRIELRPGPESEKIGHMQEEHARLQTLFDTASQDHTQLSEKLLYRQKQLEKWEQELRTEGGDLFHSRAELEAERSRLEGELRKVEGKLRDLASGVAPLLMIPSLLDTTEKHIQQESEAQKQRLLINALRERDSNLTKSLRRRKVAANVIATIDKLLESDRKQREQVATSGQVMFRAEEELNIELRHLRLKVLPDIADQVQRHLRDASDFQETLTRLEQKLAAVPAEDTITPLLKQQNHLRQQLREQQAEFAVHEEKVNVLKRQLASADEALKRMLGSDVETQMISEEGRRILHHSEAARETLSKFRVAMIRRHAEQLERLVLESFQYLLRKRHLVTALKINPETFAIELTGGDAKPLPIQRLSQGERQLLATALLWGLAKASGRPLPTIIDTPLGRLDSSHRRHMVDRYFPVASHQVILLSTDEEVDEESWQRLKPYIGKSYHLSFDDSSHSTTATEGYFWHHETTR